MIQVDIITLPASWASALINNDTSGLQQDELDYADYLTWKQTIKPSDMHVVNCEGEEYFTRSLHLYCSSYQKGMAMDYITHTIIEG